MSIKIPDEVIAQIISVRENPHHDHSGPGSVGFGGSQQKILLLQGPRTTTWTSITSTTSTTSTTMATSTTTSVKRTTRPPPRRPIR